MRTVTLSDLQTRVRQRSDTVNSSRITTSELNGYINSSYAELWDILLDSFGTNYSVSTGSIVSSGSLDQYSLPSDFLYPINISQQCGSYWRNCSLVNSWSELNNFQLNGGNQAIHYLITDQDNIWFAPKPASGTVFRIIYAKACPVLVSDTDVLNGVNGYEEFIVVDAARKIMEREESDVSALIHERDRLIARIQRAAENRGQGATLRIRDVHSGWAWPWA